MSMPQEQPRPAYAPLAVLLTSVLLVGLALTWTYLGMRAVMDVGGSCASGGPYEIATPCPDGAVLISLGIPVLVASALLGSGLALRLRAPTLLLPMWAVLFGTLGWNFLDYGFRTADGPVWGWVICGVVFELMALPAVAILVLGLRSFRMPAAADVTNPAAWWAAYVVLAGAGLALGAWTFAAWS
jgi:hypothetical protein